jgi:hypothetical protein
MLCLSLVLACSCSTTWLEDRPWLGYTLRWTCISPEGCERAEQAPLIDRVGIKESKDFCDFWSTGDGTFRIWADLLHSDSLPPDCFLLSGFAVFGHELEPSLLCYAGEDFEIELSIPDRDSPTHSQWRIEGRYTGRLVDTPPPR